MLLIGPESAISCESNQTDMNFAETYNIGQVPIQSHFKLQFTHPGGHAKATNSNWGDLSIDIELQWFYFTSWNFWFSTSPPQKFLDIFLALAMKMLSAYALLSGLTIVTKYARNKTVEYNVSFVTYVFLVLVLFKSMNRHQFIFYKYSLELGSDVCNKKEKKLLFRSWTKEHYKVRLFIHQITRIPREGIDELCWRVGAWTN